VARKVHLAVDMKNQTKSILAAFVTMSSFAACVSQDDLAGDEQLADESSDGKSDAAGATFYTVVQQGPSQYSVRRANGRTLNCPDAPNQTVCTVSSVDLASLSLSPSAEKSARDLVAFNSRDGVQMIAQGKMVKLNGETKLAVAHGWVAQVFATIPVTSKFWSAKSPCSDCGVVVNRANLVTKVTLDGLSFAVSAFPMSANTKLNIRSKTVATGTIIAGAIATDDNGIKSLLVNQAYFPL
jgi:hypothetical protein